MHESFVKGSKHLLDIGSTIGTTIINVPYYLLKGFLEWVHDDDYAHLKKKTKKQIKEDKEWKMYEE